MNTRLPPHRFTVNGAPWQMRYGDPSHEAMDDPEDDLGVCVWAERMIYLDVSLRRKANREKCWGVFVHELWHAITGCDTHRAISQGSLELNIGRWLSENL